MQFRVKCAARVRDAHPPKSANVHRGVVERVIEVGDSPEVDAANAGNGRLSVEGSGTWKHRDDLERLFEFLGEHVGVVAIGRPPGLLSPNVFLRSGCEANAGDSVNAIEVREGSHPRRRDDPP